MMPSRPLGWTDAEASSGRHARSYGEEAEPSLGSLTSCGSYMSQEAWGRGNTDDREEQCEDEGARQLDIILTLTTSRDKR